MALEGPGDGLEALVDLSGGVGVMGQRMPHCTIAGETRSDAHSIAMNLMSKPGRLDHVDPSLVSPVSTAGGS